MLGVSGTIAEPGQPALAATEGRRTDIDGLRIVVCGSVILLHSLLIFADEPRYHLKSDVTSQFASVAFRFVHIFSMPTFFVLAGWSAVASLRVREPIQFVRERVLRLIVPLVSGMVLFVGLVAPHLIRLAFGPAHRLVVPGGMLVGAILVAGADAVARTVAAPAELPLGVFTALIGVPFFIALLARQREAWTL